MLHCISKSIFVVVVAGSDGKESACNAGDLGSVSGSGRSPGEENRQQSPVFVTGEFRGQRSQAGYSPEDGKELGETKSFTVTYY